MRRIVFIGPILNDIHIDIRINFNARNLNVDYNSITFNSKFELELSNFPISNYLKKWKS